jgi:hypothetical protein
MSASKARITLAATILMAATLIHLRISHWTWPVPLGGGQQSIRSAAQQTSGSASDGDTGVAQVSPSTAGSALSSVSGSATAASTASRKTYGDIYEALKHAQHRIEEVSPQVRARLSDQEISHHAWNPAQSLAIGFRGASARIQAAADEPEWSAVLRYHGGEGATSKRIDGNRIEMQHADGNVEWYVNHEEAIEHGFTIHDGRLLMQGERLVIPLEVDGLAVENSPDSHDSLVFKNDAGAPVLAYSKLKVWDAGGRVLPAEMFPVAGGLAIAVAARDARYPITVDPIITNLETTFQRASGVNTMNFGKALAISKNTTSYRWAAATTGSDVFIFRDVLNGSSPNWELHSKVEPEVYSSLAESVDIEVFGDVVHVVVGYPYADTEAGTGAGRVVHYKLHSPYTGPWVEHRVLEASDGAANDGFGTSVAISLTDHLHSRFKYWPMIIVGAPRATVNGLTQAGKVYLFSQSALFSNGTFEQVLSNPTPAAYQEFGRSVALDMGARVLNYSIDGVTSIFTNQAGIAVVAGNHDALLFTQYLQEDFQFSQRLLASGAGSMAFDGQTRTIVLGRYGQVDIFEARIATNEYMRVEVLWADEPSYGEFGSSVDIDADRVVVGARVGAGKAYTYERLPDGLEWTKTGEFSAPDSSQQFGASVAIGGNHVLVGQPNTPNEGYFAAGAAFAYLYSPHPFTALQGTWSGPQAIQTGWSNERFGQTFVEGRPFDLEGDTAAIGSQFQYIIGVGYTGAVYIFGYQAGGWVAGSRILANDPEGNGYFGSAVSLAGDAILVGVPWGRNPANVETGSAYIFRRSGSVWSQEAKLLPSAGASGDRFGACVSLSADRALVGAPTPSGANSGSAYVFSRSGAVWTEEARLSVPGLPTTAQFGLSVSLDGNRALIGSPYGGGPGSAHLFERVEGSWMLLQALAMPSSLAGDWFGKSVALDGDTLVVGAPGARSTHVFERQGGVWSHTARLTDPLAGSRFGWSVDVDGTCVLAGSLSGPRTSLFAKRGPDWRHEHSFQSPDVNDADAGRIVALSGNRVLLYARGRATFGTLQNITQSFGRVYSYTFALPTLREIYEEAVAATSGLTGSNALPGALPFKDGVPNLLKYAFNMNLSGPDARTLTTASGTAGLPWAGLAESASGPVFRIEYLRRKGSGLHYVPKVSSNLDNFVPMIGDVTTSEISPEWERVIIEAPWNPASTPKLFGRVEVSLP